MKPITIAVSKIHCIEETRGPGSDEPYIIVFAADMTKLPPDVQSTLYGPYSDVDTGEVIRTRGLFSKRTKNNAFLIAIHPNSASVKFGRQNRGESPISEKESEMKISG